MFARESRGVPRKLRDISGWEQAEDLDEYFMTVTASATSPRPPPAATGMTAEYVEPPPKLAQFGEIATQTPYFWPTLEVIGEATEAAPRRATERRAPPDAGTSPPCPFFRPSNEMCKDMGLIVRAPRSPCAGVDAPKKEPKEQTISWFKPWRDTRRVGGQRQTPEMRLSTSLPWSRPTQEKTCRLSHVCVHAPPLVSLLTDATWEHLAHSARANLAEIAIQVAI